MKFNATQIPYHSTGLFSKLVNDYIEAKPSALAFANYAPNLEGVAKAIEQLPAATVPVQLWVPSETVTLPAGVPFPGAVTVTL